MSQPLGKHVTPLGQHPTLFLHGTWLALAHVPALSKKESAAYLLSSLASRCTVLDLLCSWDDVAEAEITAVRARNNVRSFILDVKQD